MAKNPFRVDWSNKDAVIAYARTLGRGMTVTYNEPHGSFNITHTENKHLWGHRPVVFQT